jgi:hypothetical protein
MAEPAKCAHPFCDCTVPPKGRFGKYCSEHCKGAHNLTVLRCECHHPECGRVSATTESTGGIRA